IFLRPDGKGARLLDIAVMEFGLGRRQSRFTAHALSVIGLSQQIPRKTVVGFSLERFLEVENGLFQMRPVAPGHKGLTEIKLKERSSGHEFDGALMGRYSLINLTGLEIYLPLKFPQIGVVRI